MSPDYLLVVASAAFYFLFFGALGTWAGHGAGGRFAVGIIVSLLGGLLGMTIFLATVVVTRRRHQPATEPDHSHVYRWSEVRAARDGGPPPTCRFCGAPE